MRDVTEFTDNYDHGADPSPYHGFVNVDLEAVSRHCGGLEAEVPGTGYQLCRSGYFALVQHGRQIRHIPSYQVRRIDYCKAVERHPGRRTSI